MLACDDGVDAVGRPRQRGVPAGGHHHRGGGVEIGDVIPRNEKVASSILAGGSNEKPRATCLKAVCGVSLAFGAAAPAYQKLTKAHLAGGNAGVAMQALFVRFVANLLTLLWPASCGPFGAVGGGLEHRVDRVPVCLPDRVSAYLLCHCL